MSIMDSLRTSFLFFENRPSASQRKLTYKIGVWVGSKRITSLWWKSTHFIFLWRLKWDRLIIRGECVLSPKTMSIEGFIKKNMSETYFSHSYIEVARVKTTVFQSEAIPNKPIPAQPSFSIDVSLEEPINVREYHKTACFYSTRFTDKTQYGHFPERNKGRSISRVYILNTFCLWNLKFGRGRGRWATRSIAFLSASGANGTRLQPSEYLWPAEGDRHNCIPVIPAISGITKPLGNYCT